MDPVLHVFMSRTASLRHHSNHAMATVSAIKYFSESQCDDVKCRYGAQCEMEAEGTVCVCPRLVSFL